jgi:hypothetical protein
VVWSPDEEVAQFVRALSWKPPVHALSTEKSTVSMLPTLNAAPIAGYVENGTRPTSRQLITATLLSRLDVASELTTPMIFCYKLWHGISDIITPSKAYLT